MSFFALEQCESCTASASLFSDQRSLGEDLLRDEGASEKQSHPILTAAPMKTTSRRSSITGLGSIVALIEMGTVRTKTLKMVWRVSTTPFQQVCLRRTPRSESSPGTVKIGRGRSHQSPATSIIVFSKQMLMLIQSVSEMNIIVVLRCHFFAKFNLLCDMLAAAGLAPNLRSPANLHDSTFDLISALQFSAATLEVGHAYTWPRVYLS